MLKGHLLGLAIRFVHQAEVGSHVSFAAQRFWLFAKCKGGRLERTRVADVKEARTKADAGQAILVDVRSAQVYEAQHVVGAISLPANELADRYSELPAGKQLIFYCD